MALQTTYAKNSLAAKYATEALFGAVYSAAGTSTAGTEPTGGSPAYARKSLTWSAPSSGVITTSWTADIPSGFTTAGYGYHTAVTAGTYVDGGALTSQAFSSQGSLVVSATFTET